MLLHVDHHIQPRDHEQFVLSIKSKDADTSIIGHVLDFSAAGHLVAFHMDQRAQIYDGGITL